MQVHIQCNQCGRWVVTSAPEAALDPDGTLECGCCPQEHDHAQAANACPGAGAGHDGVPCGLGVPGCTVCRPITITVLKLAPLGAVVA